MGLPLRVLLLEDSETDVALVQEELSRAELAPEILRACTREEYLHLLEDQKVDLVLAGLQSATFDGMSALRDMRESGRDLPVILLGEAFDEDVAVEGLKMGASDYVVKSRLWRLPRAISRALEDRTPLASGTRGKSRIEKIFLQQAERTLRHQKTLLELSALENVQFAPTLELIIKADAATLDVERVSFWMFEEDSLRCDVLYRRSREIWEFGHVISAGEYPRYFESLRSKAVIAAHDAWNDPQTAEFGRDYLEQLGITSMLDVPVWQGGRLAGVVCHEHVGSPREWTSDEQAFAASIGHLISLALAENERQIAESARKESEERFRVTFEKAAVGIGNLN
ncbi:MAG: response regulator, partial [Verrucomicrobiaceae bacterium]